MSIDNTGRVPGSSTLAEEVQNLAVQALDLKDAVRANQRFSRVVAALYIIDILLIVAIGGGGLLYKSHNDCQVAQNDAFRESSIQARGARDRQDKQTIELLDQQLTLFNIVLAPSSTPDEKTAAVLQYKKSIASAKTTTQASIQQRVDNPFPAGNCS